MKGPQEKSFVFAFAAVWIGLILGCVSLEAGLRLQHLAAVPTNVQLDRELGWFKEPFIATEMHSRASILFLGDSFTAPRDGYVARVQMILSSKKRPCTVVNAGVSGYGTVQELRMWEKYQQQLRPNIVVLALFAWNDLSDNLNEISYSPYTNLNRPYAVVRGNVVTLQPQSGTRYVATWLSQYSALLRFINYRWLAYKAERQEIFYLTFAGRWAPFYQTYPQERIEKAYTALRATLQQLQDEVRREHAELIVVAFDNSFTAEAVYAQQMQNELPFFRNLDLDIPVNRVAAICRDLHAPFLNLRDAFRGYTRRHPDRHLYEPPPGGHFTSLGADRAAEEIAQFLIQRNMVQ